MAVAVILCVDTTCCTPTPTPPQPILTGPLSSAITPQTANHLLANEEIEGQGGIRSCPGPLATVSAYQGHASGLAPSPYTSQTTLRTDFEHHNSSVFLFLFEAGSYYVSWAKLRLVL